MKLALHNKTFQFLATFVIGAVLGGYIYQKWTEQPDLLDAWGDTEEAVLAKMQDFQDRLTMLESARPDSVEALTKHIVAQEAIMDVMIKYRQTQQAKKTPWFTFAGTISPSLLGGLFGWITARFSSKNSPVGK